MFERAAKKFDGEWLYVISSLHIVNESHARIWSQLKLVHSCSCEQRAAAIYVQEYPIFGSK